MNPYFRMTIIARAVSDACIHIGAVWRTNQGLPCA